MNVPALRYEQDDFLIHHEEWVSKADIVFANATCFEPEMVHQVEELMKTRFRSGQVFMLTTKDLNLPESDFTMVGPLTRMMTWGETKLRAYVKK